MSKFSKCDSLMTQILRIERGCRCQLSGGYDERVGVFHILSKATHPRLRYAKKNLLLASWFGDMGHNTWHSNYYKAQRIEDKIKQILGINYKEELEILNRMMPRVDLKLTYLALKQELENLKKGKNV